MRIDVHLHPGELGRALREDVERGLTMSPKELPPKWFYDERGSQLFDQITRLPEYYPTRREREILLARSHEIAATAAPDSLVELGSGTSEKTQILLDALVANGSLRTFVPFDVSEQTLRDASASIERAYSLDVHAVVGDFDRHLSEIPNGGRRLVAFLGGTIGNFGPDDRARFLKELGASLAPGDHLLIGFDLVKDVGRLEAAYNDSRGVTADFNRNVLSVINRELDADFDLNAFEHRAFFDRDDSWIEMRLVARGEQRVRVEGLDLDVCFEDGEQMRTEISTKFMRDGISTELIDAGFVPVSFWTDEADDFLLALAAISI
ncbi:MAG: L-histidine N(alpha)-methyltransferase [Actinomycetota bacterium]